VKTARLSPAPTTTLAPSEDNPRHRPTNHASGQTVKQIAQNYKSGEIALLDVPVPACRPGGVLVRSEFSLISRGTEAQKIHESKLSLIGKARARPDQVRKVVETMGQLGPVATYKKVMNRLDSYTPLGYSLARQHTFALHAEYNWVPKNMCVAVPANVSQLDACFTTVGAIAMQGFRQSDATLGETACVIGLGLVGQILVQILRAAGVQAPPHAAFPIIRHSIAPKLRSWR
jgi:threonine dehydrogenase-like Zn-dependent dehydrogenase